MNKIKNIKAREILNSRGNPTIEVELETDEGVFIASVPSGASKGKYEAVELRDGGKRYNGKGVLRAVENINKVIAPKLKGKNPIRQEIIDNLMVELDGTENKSKLGANAILAVSIAVCRAGAASKNISLWEYISQLAKTKPALPRPSVLVIEGGLHVGNKLDVQEFMIVPSADSFQEQIRLVAESYHTLRFILLKKYGEFATNVGYEGGLAAPAEKTEEALRLITEAIEKSGYKNKIKIAIDVAASTFYSKNGSYKFEGVTFTKDGFLGFYSDLVKKYPIISLEDPYDQEDWKGFQKITERLGKKITIIGDDLLACNGLILKPNQIGTVTETLKAAELARFYGWKIMVSHRSGDTCDDFISDLAVGVGANFIKAGAPVRGERVAKYNRLLEVEQELKKGKKVKQ